jgi:hypothetical protein
VAAHPEVDALMAAIVGAAGLPPTLAAVNAGKRVLLANKEALVMSGALFMQAVKRMAPCCCRSTVSTTRSSSACRVTMPVAWIKWVCAAYC